MGAVSRGAGSSGIGSTGVASSGAASTGAVVVSQQWYPPQQQGYPPQVIRPLQSNKAIHLIILQTSE